MTLCCTPQLHEKTSKVRSLRVFTAEEDFVAKHKANGATLIMPNDKSGCEKGSALCGDVCFKVCRFCK